MVEQDAARRVQVVRLAVVHRDPVAVELGDAVGGAGVEGRGLGLRDLDDLAEHLRGRRLVEADPRVGDADGVEQARHAQAGHVTREHRLAEAGLHEALRRQVVDLLRLPRAEQVDHRGLVQQVALDGRDAVLDVGDPLERDGRGPAHHADDLVPLAKEVLGQVRAVLTSNSGDECALGHGCVSSACTLSGGAPSGRR